ncbi:MAG: alkaline phosphatase family protein [Deltaproteobacteria bacterium]|nr:alkaline phosphatase family protein [Deltaproteobacteria bacterium]
MKTCSGLAPLTVAALLAGLLACSPAGAPPGPRGRALLVGIDGASPKLVAELIGRGELPNLAALAERGASGTLRSLEPILSPRIWTTMATGKLPEEHGIEHFARMGPGRRPQLYTAGAHSSTRASTARCRRSGTSRARRASRWAW